MGRGACRRVGRGARAVCLPLLVAVSAGSVTALLISNEMERSSRARLEQRGEEIGAALTSLQDEVDGAIDIAQGALGSSFAEKPIEPDSLAAMPSVSAIVDSVAIIDARGALLASNGDPRLLTGAQLDLRTGNLSQATPSLVLGGQVDGLRIGFAAPTNRSEVFVYAEVALAPDALRDAPGDVSFSLRAPIDGDDVELLSSGEAAEGPIESFELTFGNRRTSLTVQQTTPTTRAVVWWASFAAGLGAALIFVTARSIRRWRRELRELGDERLLLDQALTQQRQVEAALGAARAHLQTVLDSSPDAIAIVDGDRGTWELLNRAELLGHRAEHLQHGIERLLHPDDIGALRGWWEHRDLRPRAAPSEIRLRAIADDGAERVLQLRLVPLRRGSHGSQRRFLATFTDITEQRAREEREAALRAELQQARHLESLGRLAGGIAHDFNNVLAAVRVHAELLADQVDASSAGHVEVIERATDRAAAMVRQLVAFARRDVGEPRLVDLREAVLAVESLVTSSAGPQVSVTLDLLARPCATCIDPSQLDQIILNLVCNARDAMPLGGSLRIATSIGPRATGLDATDHALLIVADTGTGIPVDVVEHVFEPFFTTKGRRGSGLGLATVYGIVSALGGHVDISSRPGEGTTVTVAFPLQHQGDGDPAAASRPRALARTRQPHASVGERPLVALMDDDLDVLAPTATMLREVGFDVVEATNGHEGLAAIARRTPDVILADVAMPGGLDGLDVAHIVGREYPGLPIVLMTGHAADRLGHRIGECPYRVVAKPFAADELIATLHEAIEGART